MEGYFPILEYCELAEVDRDTAYHRAARGMVDSFKDKEGRLFIYYFKDETKVPENFIPFKEYAKQKGVSYSALHLALTKGEFIKEDVVTLAKDKIKKGTRSKIFINPDAIRRKRTREVVATELCPDGYITAKEWRLRNNVAETNFSQMIIFDRIPTIKIGQNRYVKEDEPLPKDKRRREA